MVSRFFLFILPLVLIPTNALCDQCVSGDCVNGSGTMKYSTGHTYTGEFKNGLRHGKAVMHMPGGRILEGTWQNNEIIEGTLTFHDGTRYEGQWKFREREGRGVLTFSDGRTYIGDFRSGQRHGQGTMVFPDGRKYVGDFNRGERTGRGTLTFPDGSVYEGEFQAGNRTGAGMMRFPDGRTQTGLFENGVFLGK